MPLIDYSFVSKGYTLRLECRIADGWRKGKKSYCYSEEIRQLPWNFGYKLRAQGSLFPLPVSLSEEWAEYRLDRATSGGHSGVKFEIDLRRLVLDVPILTANGEMNNELPWRDTDTKKACITWEDKVYANPPYRISMLVVFDPPPSGPPPVVRDWFKRFYPGGLPSLGKKR